MNKTLFHDKGLEIKIKKKCNNSWLEISKVKKTYLKEILVESDQQEEEKFMDE